MDQTQSSTSSSLVHITENAPTEPQLEQARTIGAKKNQQPPRNSIGQRIAIRLLKQQQQPKPAAGWSQQQQQQQQQTRKRALFIGCNYAGTSGPLQQCIHDAFSFYELATSIYGFLWSRQTMAFLVDDGSSEMRPTKANMVAGMLWLLDGARSGDTLLLVFSGHGTRVTAAHCDESDGMDEAICPCDYESAGVLRDNELHELLVRRVPLGARLTVIVDACHSGSVLDLPFKHMRNANTLGREIPSSTSGGMGAAESFAKSPSAATDGEGAHDNLGRSRSRNLNQTHTTRALEQGSLDEQVDATADTTAGAEMNTETGKRTSFSDDCDTGIVGPNLLALAESASTSGAVGGDAATNLTSFAQQIKQYGGLTSMPCTPQVAVIGEMNKPVGAGHVLLISGCRDDQLSLDGGIGGRQNGALSGSLLSVLEKKPNISVGELLDRAAAAIPDSYNQSPQLSSSHKVNFYNLRFL